MRKHMGIPGMKYSIGAAAAALAMVGAAGCTKERPYEEVYKKGLHKQDVHPKDTSKGSSLFDPGAEYLYVASETYGTRTTSATRPFGMGAQKIVRLRYVPDGFEVIETEPDPRFAGNPTNTKPLFKVQGKHIEYRCAKNAAGECSNKEEENNEIAWDRKSYFMPDFSSMPSAPVLDTEIENLFFPCHEEVGTNFVGYRVEPDALNIEFEKVYRTRPMCADDASSFDEFLSNMTFVMRRNYSLVKLSSIASPKYEPVEYPRKDENAFGFFTTEYSKLSIDNRSEEKDQVVLMNRWNPTRKEIVYHLSDEFSKPEHAAVKAATYKAVAAISDGFRRAGVDLKVTLKEPSGKNPGDLRNSMIVMVEDPQPVSLLGYGPVVANPRTGEILSGRVVMYLGNITKYIRNSYEEFLEEHQARLRAAAKAAAPAPGASPIPSPAPSSAPAIAEALSAAAPSALASLELDKAFAAMKEMKARERSRTFDGGAQLSSRDLDTIRAMARDYRRNSNPRATLADLKAGADGHDHEGIEGLETQASARIDALSRHNFYPAELFNFRGVVVGVLSKLDETDLKPWDELTEAQKQKVIDAVLPHVWIPTLVHELGHNMGLRHNFAGSEDKANFYTPEELKALGLEGTKPAYSSVMDYAYRATNELHVLGKYDVAALRFGYLREVETADGRRLKVPGTLKALKAPAKGEEKLKEYEYCTDEHVGPNAGCKRFDEGTSLTEIALHLAKSYEDNYKRRNFRNGRRSFSLMDDDAYASQMSALFRDMRAFFEVYDRISSRFELSDEQWESEPFLKDVADATKVSEQFFLSVLAQPDVHCAILNVKEGKIKGMISPAAAGAISCFDGELQAALDEKMPGHKVIAQAGKHFSSMKSPKSDNPYADQIDVRGIWLDKLLAARYLLKRELGVGTFDSTTSNYLDGRPEFAGKFLGLVQSMIDDRIRVPNMPFRTADGEVLALPLQYSIFESHMIQKSLTARSRAGLGLDEAPETPFIKALVRTMLREMPTVIENPVSRGVVDAFTVSQSPRDGFSASEQAMLETGNRRYYALERNVIARAIFKRIETARLFKGVSEERLEELAELARVVHEASEGKTPGPEFETEASGEPDSAEKAGERAIDAQEASAPKLLGGIKDKVSAAISKVLRRKPRPTPSPAPSPSPSPSPSPERPLTEQEKAIVKLGPQAIDDYLQGRTKSESYYSAILEVLAEAQSSR